MYAVEEDKWEAIHNNSNVSRGFNVHPEMNEEEMFILTIDCNLSFNNPEGCLDNPRMQLDFIELRGTK